MLKIKWLILLIITVGLILLISPLSLARDADIDPEQCSYNGIPLYGKVQFVESFPDLEIKFVESFPDLEVKFVENFPDDCGEWEIVTSFPDFTIKPVTSFPDLEVEIVESFPGIP
ncbi:MAG: hypothetical protein AAGG51_05425 [Cyanobacteria bacterium P01_G01_bin.54]